MTTGLLIRILIYLVIAGAIFFAVRKIWKDWKGAFKAEDSARRARDLRERARPDVITLTRDKDGTFRPPGEDDRPA